MLEADGAQHERLRCLLPRPVDRTFGTGEPARIGPAIGAHAVILFADLRGHSRISEKLSPRIRYPCWLNISHFSRRLRIRTRSGHDFRSAFPRCSWHRSRCAIVVS